MNLYHSILRKDGQPVDIKFGAVSFTIEEPIKHDYLIIYQIDDKHYQWVLSDSFRVIDGGVLVVLTPGRDISEMYLNIPYVIYKLR